ncbi:MAG: IclR family transcriptional regulator [Solirubrobacterales bacterium]
MTPLPPGEKPGNQLVGSVGRAIELIDSLAAAPEGLGVNELARRIEVNPSTASRLLATLEQGGLVRRDDRGRFQLGLKLLALADLLATRLDVRELSRPHLHALVERTGETVTLSVPSAGQAVTVEFVPGKSSVVSMARVGRPNVLHATAIGKTMLAFGPDARIPAAAELTRFTERTIDRVGELERVVGQVREAGWAESVAEREDDLAALAAPVFGADRQLAAIVGLQGPLARMTNARRLEILPEVLATARAISAELGGA